MNLHDPAPAADKNQVQVIARAAAILRALENQPVGLSLGDIAKRVDLARSTVQRIVAALGAEKLVVAASSAGRVRLGPAILRLATSVKSDFIASARPFLVAMSKELRETVDLASVQGDHLVFIDQVVGPHRLRMVSAVGDRFPLYCTANGKAWLAELDDVEINLMFSGGMEGRTPNTIRRLDDLLAEIQEVRRSGVAFDKEEHTVGVNAVGVALRDGSGSPVAISVPVPTARFLGREELIAQKLLATKAAIEAAVLAEKG